MTAATIGNLTISIIFLVIAFFVIGALTVLKWVSTGRLQMWWWILGVVAFCAAWTYWRFIQ